MVSVIVQFDMPFPAAATATANALAIELYVFNSDQIGTASGGMLNLGQTLHLLLL
jgi:hypothetical protein